MVAKLTNEKSLHLRQKLVYRQMIKTLILLCLYDTVGCPRILLRRLLGCLANFLSSVVPNSQTSNLVRTSRTLGQLAVCAANGAIWLIYDKPRFYVLDVNSNRFFSFFGQTSEIRSFIKFVIFARK